MNEPGSHFLYHHLPSSGMERRDPQRPYVSGGLGAGIPIFITQILQGRVYDANGRLLLPIDRELVDRARSYMRKIRAYANRSRFYESLNRFLIDVSRVYATIDRAMGRGGRSLRSVDRDLE